MYKTELRPLIKHLEKLDALQLSPVINFASMLFTFFRGYSFVHTKITVSGD